MVVVVVVSADHAIRLGHKPACAANQGGGAVVCPAGNNAAICCSVRQHLIQAINRASDGGAPSAAIPTLRLSHAHKNCMNSLSLAGANVLPA